MKRRALTFVAAAAALELFLGAPRPARAAAGVDSANIRVSKASATEQYERDVDEVALASQEKAISRLTTLLKKYRGTRQEPVLLAKLADLQLQNGAILFRISHGQAHHKSSTGRGGGLNLDRYNKQMSLAISTLNTLIAKYPNFEEIARSFYQRGKAYEEIGSKDKATHDYLHLVKSFPDAEETVPAFMSLAEFSIQANEHAKAIGYLREVEKHADSPHYPFALYKLAWSHYNLKEIATALSYAERQIAFYNQRGADRAQGDTAATSDAALRENTLMDLAVFYFEGYEQKKSDYALDKALPYFRKIESGPVLGRMLIRFSKLLRSHNHNTDLVSWKDQVLQSESERPESLEVLLIAYEHQLNKRSYEQLVESAQDMVKLYQKGKRYESFVRAQKMVLDTAEGLQQSVVKNKDATEVRKYSTILATIYDSFTRIVEDSDVRIPRVHYNLAETLFAIKDFAGATEHYRWVVEHGSWREKDNKEGAGGKVANAAATVYDASLKAIASRYEVLRQKQLIPGELTPRVMSKTSPNQLDKILSEWVEWIDTRAKKIDKDMDNFLFESSRVLYAQGHIADATDRMLTFVRKFPKSKYAIPSASLVLDTLIASEEWEKTHDQATDFMKVAEWKTGDFSKKLYTVAADAFFKRFELLHKAKEYKAAMKGADEFLKKYPESARVGDTLSLAGTAALALGDKTRASDYFTRLIKEAQTNKSIPIGNVGAALLSRATMSEEKYQFASAALDYRAFLMLPSAGIKIDEGKADEMRRKTLTLTWLSDDVAELRSMLESKAICTESVAVECEKYRALSILATPELARKSETTEDAFDRARKNKENGSSETRVLWAAIALEGAKHLAFRDRNLMIRTVTGGWGDQDPLIRYALLPYLTASIPKAFQMNRMAMREVAPLRADERYITRRVEVIREMENAATKALKLPWARIRAEVVNEIASLYLDLARGLVDLKPPKGLNEQETTAYQDTIRKLVLPFEEKGQEMRGKAFEIASKFAIEEDSFQRISEPFFAENPSQAKKLKLTGSTETPAAMDVTLLERLDPDGDWHKARSRKLSDDDDAATRVRSLWAQAIHGRKWQQVAYFMQEAQEKKIVNSAVTGTVKAISLALAGARGEGLAEIEQSRKDFAPKARTYATSMLLQYYLRAFAQDKTEALTREIQESNETGGEKPAPAKKDKSPSKRG